MSALGQKQTYAAQNSMSALPPIATSNATQGNVRFGPIADIAPVIPSGAINKDVGGRPRSYSSIRWSRLDFPPRVVAIDPARADRTGRSASALMTWYIVGKSRQVAR